MVLLPPRANEYTVAQVAQGMETGRVGTDEVSLNHVPGRRTAVEIDALSAIARDDVTCTDGRAPHRVVGSAEYVDAVAKVAQWIQPADVGTDEVALHHVARRAGAAGDLNAITHVGRNNVSGPIACPTYGVVAPPRQ